LNEHNTVFVRSGPLYATGVSLGPPESSTQTASRSLQPFLTGALHVSDRPTDRPTDHATPSVTIGGAYSGEGMFHAPALAITHLERNGKVYNVLRYRCPVCVVRPYNINT